MVDPEMLLIVLSSKPFVYALPTVGDSVGAILILSPTCQPEGELFSEMVVAPEEILPAARTNAVLAEPTRSNTPDPIAHKPTSVVTTSIPPPTNLVSSILINCK